ncbi:MAG: hypothetical protein WDN10_02740 [bacterium]
MRKAFILTLVAFSALAATPLIARTTDAEVRGQMIRESIASYPGNCPCPYSTMRNGRSCGGRSAYSRPGGYAPLCYPSDVSDDMVRGYRSTHGLGN